MRLWWFDWIDSDPRCHHRRVNAGNLGNQTKLRLAGCKARQAGKGREGWEDRKPLAITPIRARSGVQSLCSGMPDVPVVVPNTLIEPGYEGIPFNREG